MSNALQITKTLPHNSKCEVMKTKLLTTSTNEKRSAPHDKDESIFPLAVRFRPVDKKRKHKGVTQIACHKNKYDFPRDRWCEADSVSDDAPTGVGISKKRSKTPVKKTKRSKTPKKKR